MPLSSGDRVVAGLTCAYFCYRIVSAAASGVYDGGGDPDVHSSTHPGAFVATLFSAAAVAMVCALIAFTPSGPSQPSSQAQLRDQPG